MEIRDWEPKDMVKLAEYHAKLAVGYQLPESFGPLFPVRKVIVDENGTPIAFATVKLVSEAMYWTDPEISSFRRTKALILLNEKCAAEAKALGLEEVSCWIPGRIAKCFSRIIEKLGWQKSPWSNWTRVLGRQP